MRAWRGNGLSRLQSRWWPGLSARWSVRGVEFSQWRGLRREEVEVTVLDLLEVVGEIRNV